MGKIVRLKAHGPLSEGGGGEEFMRDNMVVVKNKKCLYTYSPTCKPTQWLLLISIFIVGIGLPRVYTIDVL